MGAGWADGEGPAPAGSGNVKPRSSDPFTDLIEAVDLLLRDVEGGWVSVYLPRVSTALGRAKQLIGDVAHVADLGEDGFSLQHPLIERLRGTLFDCTIHTQLSEADPAGWLSPGRYRVTPNANDPTSQNRRGVLEDFTWERIGHGG